MTRTFVKLVYILSACALLSGCSTPYMKNRGNDLADVFDIGITANGGKPQFGLFLDFFNIAPLGWSDIEATKVGLQNRRFGVMPYESKNWGLLLAGKELCGATDSFNPLDPHQARPDQADLTVRPAFDSGLISIANGTNTPSVVQFLDCQRGLHLGWVGLHLSLRPFDVVDFVLGFTTWDIMRDDLAGKEPAALAQGAK